MFPRALGRIMLATVDVATDTLARARQVLLGTRANLDATSRIYLEARIEALSGDPRAITVGAHTHVRGQLLISAHGGRLELGSYCFVGEGSQIWSAANVRVGDRVLISHGCEIHDWDAHPLDAAQRHAQFRHVIEHGHPRDSFGSSAAPIRIEDDAWLGFGSTVLKGVTIGARSIVAARSVVTADVPPDTIVAGNPAKIVRSLAASPARARLQER
jgi:acetyltransferase-like isoleucine patch superfamily enzyme